MHENSIQYIGQKDETVNRDIVWNQFLLTKETKRHISASGWADGWLQARQQTAKIGSFGGPSRAAAGGIRVLRERGSSMLLEQEGGVQQLHILTYYLYSCGEKQPNS